MTSTLSSVTLSEDIIFGGTAGADLLAGVRSTIMRIYTWLFMVVRWEGRWWGGCIEL